MGPQSTDAEAGIGRGSGGDRDDIVDRQAATAKAGLDAQLHGDRRPAGSRAADCRWRRSAGDMMVSSAPQAIASAAASAGTG